MTNVLVAQRYAENILSSEIKRDGLGKRRRVDTDQRPRRLLRTYQCTYEAIFHWDSAFTSTKLKLDETKLTCTSIEGSGFKTTVGTEKFYAGGRYYFELFLNKGQLVKIGVCRPTPLNLEEAFCDTVNGWGIYNGETRHNSNSTGSKYGVQLQTGDILGVAVDMIDGTVIYYRNGQSWGVAFKDPQLATGELVAAISPIYVNDVVTLRSLIKED